MTFQKQGNLFSHISLWRKMLLLIFFCFPFCKFSSVFLERYIGFTRPQNNQKTVGLHAKYYPVCFCDFQDCDTIWGSMVMLRNQYFLTLNFKFWCWMSMSILYLYHTQRISHGVLGWVRFFAVAIENLRVTLKIYSTKTCELPSSRAP